MVKSRHSKNVFRGNFFFFLLSFSRHYTLLRYYHTRANSTIRVRARANESFTHRRGDVLTASDITITPSSRSPLPPSGSRLLIQILQYRPRVRVVAPHAGSLVLLLNRVTIRRVTFECAPSTTCRLFREPIVFFPLRRLLFPFLLSVRPRY